ncbi:MAG: outer membrane lipoprotein LolB [Gammaproteobacteria bacterium]|nr:outer membrane lipoprotein LolB [Gammaproteobacteria bacterium]
MLLSSCATTAPEPELTTPQKLQLWQQRQQQMSSFQTWGIRGRVALFIDNDVYNLGLNWIIAEDHSTLKLEAALGQGMIQLQRNAAEVSLTTSEGDSYYGQNAEQVLQQSTGWSIPVDGLESWIKGINHAQSSYTQTLDNTGLASTLTQDRWKINYLDYTRAELEQYNNPLLPHKIYMKRDNIALKIVIDQWQPEQNSSSSDLFPAFPE